MKMAAVTISSCQGSRRCEPVGIRVPRLLRHAVSGTRPTSSSNLRWRHGLEAKVPAAERPQNEERDQRQQADYADERDDRRTGARGHSLGNGDWTVRVISVP